MAQAVPVTRTNQPPRGGWATAAADGRLIAADATFAALFRATPDQLIGRPWTALAAPQAAPQIEAALHTLATGAPWSGHVECLATGIVIDLTFDVHPIAGATGRTLVLRAAPADAALTRPADDAIQLATWQAAHAPGAPDAAARAVLQEIAHAIPFDWGTVLRFVDVNASDARVLATYPSDMAGIATGRLLGALDAGERSLRESGEPALFGALRTGAADRSPLARLPAYGMQSALKIPLFTADAVTGALLLYALEPQAFDAADGIAIERYGRPLGTRLGTATAGADDRVAATPVAPMTPAASAFPLTANAAERAPAPAPSDAGAPATTRAIGEPPTESANVPPPSVLPPATPAARAESPIEADEHQLSADLERERLSQIGQLVSGVAHELNNPLTAILGYAQLLPALTEDDRKFAIETIEQEAVRAGRIVRNLLYFARQHRPQVEPIDLNALLTRIIDVRRYNYAVDNVVVDLRLGQIPLAPGDRYQLEQVFLNLLNNAHQALRATGGTITVISAPVPGAVRVTVSDNGPGIPEPLRARIFEPFFTTHEVGEGTGLGLSIAYGIVQQHDGRLWVESPPGGGAQLVVELPLTHAVPAADQPLATDASAPAPRGTRLLVVDDERAVRILMAELLAVEGYEPLQAASAAEALEILARIPNIAALVCDVRMPVMDGHALYREVIRRWPQLAGHFLFVTGETLRDRASRIESEQYLEKPFDAKQLQAGVRRVLGARANVAS